MNLRLLGAVLGALLLASCASVATRIDDLASIKKADNAFVVVQVDNQSKRGFFNPSPYQVDVYLKSGLQVSEALPIALSQDQRKSLLVYNIKPGTYRVDNFVVTGDGLLGKEVAYSFLLDKVFYTYFTVRAGEVAYLGTFLLQSKNEPELTSAIRMAQVQDELIAKNPLFEGYRWFSLEDDRPSFF